jgi:hypothetical protein
VKAGSEEVEMARISYRMPAIIPLTLVLLSSAALGAGLDEITVKWSSEGTIVTLACDSPVSFKHYKLADPSRIYIECAGLKNNIKGHSYPGINRGGVAGISISRFEQADFSRIAISTAKPFDYTALSRGSDIVLTLKTGGTVSAFPEWQAKKAEALVFKPPKEEVKPAAVEAPSAVTTETKKSSMVKGEAGSRLISMDLEDADLLTVLRALAEYSGRNIVAGKGVSGSVTVSLRNVGWLTALETILKANGLAYIEERGIIRVATPAEIARIQDEEERAALLVDKVYRIEFATVEEIASVISKSVSRSSIHQLRRWRSLSK